MTSLERFHDAVDIVSESCANNCKVQDEIEEELEGMSAEEFAEFQFKSVDAISNLGHFLRNALLGRVNKHGRAAERKTAGARS